MLIGALAMAESTATETATTAEGAAAAAPTTGGVDQDHQDDAAADIIILLLSVLTWLGVVQLSKLVGWAWAYC